MNGDLADDDVAVGREGDMMGPDADMAPPPMFCPRLHVLLWAREDL